MKVWIQSHDFASRDLKDGSMAAAIGEMESFNWDAELLKEQKAVEAKEESCPPGIGFNHDSGSFLHIVPSLAGDASVFYETKVPCKLLGFIPSSKSQSVSAEGVPKKVWPELIEAHYRDARDEVLSRLAYYDG